MAANCHSRDSLHLSEMRIVLLGSRLMGKSSSGNTILAREEFDLRTAAQCVKRQGEVAGRQVTVVDTPGWWDDFLVEKTTELVKQEIVQSVSLCPPGPHTLLLVIEVKESFTEKNRRSVEQHMQLLSETVWSHTILLFTIGDCLGDTSIEQHIESEGEALQWLVEKCGNRYHVFNNENRRDVTQVPELFEKIEEMVAGNRGGHFEIERERLEKIEIRTRTRVKRAIHSSKKVEKQREIHRTFIGDSLLLSELRIVVLGNEGAGKSSSGNTILGRMEFDLRTAAQCVKRQGEVAGRQVTVVDTPGWKRDLPEEETPELVKQEIVHSVSLCPPGPHTLLLLIRVDVSLTNDAVTAIEEHLELLSETVWGHTILLFTRGDCLGDTSIEQHIQREGKILQWLVEKCGNRYHVFNNENRQDITQVPELFEKIEELLAVNRPHTLLLLIRVDVSLTNDAVTAIEEHLELLSETVWGHTILLFTRGDCLGDTSIEQHIQREGKILQWLVEKCGNRYHVFNNENRQDVTQVPELFEKIEELLACI
ncbi:GTPase IMAP family member 8-like [Aplochiton taeniatus]